MPCLYTLWRAQTILHCISTAILKVEDACTDCLRVPRLRARAEDLPKPINVRTEVDSMK